MTFYNLFTNHFQVFIPELFLGTFILLLLVYGINKGINEITWLTIFGLFIVGALVINNPMPASLIFQKMFLNDSLANFVKILVLVGAISSLLISISYFKQENLHSYEYSILIALVVLALFLLVSANDLITLYLAIELQSLSLYVLAAFKRNSEFSTEAGLKYFILGAFSSGLLLFGSSILYGFTGMTNFNDLALFFSLPFNENSFVLGGVYIAITFIASALLFKLAAAPFYNWAPDVYQGAPTSVTAFFAITPKVAILVLFIRLYIGTFYPILAWRTIIIICSIASMLIGALGGLYQTNIKRLLAYSAIGHAGYLLIGVVVATPEAIQGILTYSIIYIVTSIGIFGLILALYAKKAKWITGIQYITQLSGLSKTNPVFAFAFTVLFFSLAGIPPLAGFYAKLYLFIAAIQESMYLIAIIGAITSVLGALYYIRIIKIMYFEDGNEQLQVECTFEQTIVVSLATMFVMLFAAYPSIILSATYQIGTLFAL